MESLFPLHSRVATSAKASRPCTASWRGLMRVTKGHQPTLNRLQSTCIRCELVHWMETRDRGEAEHTCMLGCRRLSCTHVKIKALPGGDWATGGKTGENDSEWERNLKDILYSYKCPLHYSYTQMCTIIINVMTSPWNLNKKWGHTLVYIWTKYFS